MSNKAVWILTNCFVFLLIQTSHYFMPEGISFRNYEDVRVLVVFVQPYVSIIVLCSSLFVWTQEQPLLSRAYGFVIVLSSFVILENVYGLDEITYYPVITYTAFVLVLISIILRGLRIKLKSSLSNKKISDAIYTASINFESIKTLKDKGEITQIEFQIATQNELEHLLSVKPILHERTV